MTCIFVTFALILRLEIGYYRGCRRYRTSTGRGCRGSREYRISTIRTGRTGRTGRRIGGDSSRPIRVTATVLGSRGGGGGGGFFEVIFLEPLHVQIK
jgi:hypothetical protein